MANLRAVIEIANSSTEVKNALLPFVDVINHNFHWQKINEREISRTARVALAWAKALYGVPFEYHPQDLFKDFETIDKEVQEAITRAIAIRYAKS